MLAQSFMSADDLMISEKQRDALQKVLVLLETEKLEHVSFRELDFDAPQVSQFAAKFNMHTWTTTHSCGTVACIGGTAELIAGEPIFSVPKTRALKDLFEPDDIDWNNWNIITTAQAARALRSYLTTGDARWTEAVA